MAVGFEDGDVIAERDDLLLERDGAARVRAEDFVLAQNVTQLLLRGLE